jgi:hypothetical protein
VDGKLVAKSSSFNPSDYDVSTDQPLHIGFGQTDYFAGRIAEVGFTIRPCLPQRSERSPLAPSDEGFSPIRSTGRGKSSPILTSCNHKCRSDESDSSVSHFAVIGSGALHIA